MLAIKPSFSRQQIEADSADDLGELLPTASASVLFKTADVFSGILGRKLLLKNGPVETDGFAMSVPFDDPDAYSLLEQLLSHLLFRSDASARDLFVSKYAEQVTAKARKVDGAKLRKALAQIVNLLDGYRVFSLWGEVYPGSASILRDRVAEEIRRQVPKPHAGVLSFMAWSLYGLDPPAGRLDFLRPIVGTASKRVSKSSYTVTLATARWLLVKLVDHLVSAEPQALSLLAADPSGASGGASREAALEAALADLGELPTELQCVLTPIKPSKPFDRGTGQEAAATAREALLGNPNDDQFVQQGADAVAARLNELSTSTGQPTGEDERIAKTTPARVIFHDTPVNKTSLLAKPPPLSDEDEEAVRRMRAYFIRVMGRRRNLLDETGSEVDVAAVIERRMTRQPIPVFRRQEKGQGFHAMILLDQSESMLIEDGPKKTTRLHQARRACRIISRALDFPFVTLTVWGYTALGDGQIDIARYDPKTEAYEVPGLEFVGTTPLHMAIKAAAAHLEPGTETKHLFALTDGVPTFARRDGVQVHISALTKWTGLEVTAARSKGMGVTGVVIGEDLKEKDALTIFGPRRFWKRMGLESFAGDLTNLVASQFVSYLNKR